MLTIAPTTKTLTATELIDGLYAAAGALIQAPRNGHLLATAAISTALAKENPTGCKRVYEAVIEEIATYYGWVDSGWKAEGRTAAQFLTNYVQGSHGKSLLDMAVDVHRLAS